VAVIAIVLVASATPAMAADAPADSLPARAGIRDTMSTGPTGPLDHPVEDPLAPPPAAVRRWQTGIVRPDRLVHMSLSLGIGVGVGVLSRSPAAGAGAAIGLGLAKELSDDRFDRVDFVADAIGAGLAALLVAALTR
jgi:hypothetical protein